MIKKREIALALSLLGSVSVLCVKGMKAVGSRLARNATPMSFAAYRDKSPEEQYAEVHKDCGT